MRLNLLSVLIAWATLISLVHSWTKEDHEIFRLRDEVVASEGDEVTFYDFLGVRPSASRKEINDAFRKRSRAIHPDKAKHNFVTTKSIPKPKAASENKKPGTHVSKGPSKKELDKFMKEATERYSRLGVVANLLKGPERERYDHFLNHGFPTWRGTGYYYTRYRPGLGTVLVGLFIVGGGLGHFYALKISYNNQVKFMDKYIREARKSAWGADSPLTSISGINTNPVDLPSPEPQSDEADAYANLNRRQKRDMEKQQKKDAKKPGRKVAGKTVSAGEDVAAAPVTKPQGERRRVQAENGKVLLVDSMHNVFLEEEDEDGNKQEFLLDPAEIPVPSIYDTAVVKLPLYLWKKAIDPFRKSSMPIEDDSVPRTETEERVKQVQRRGSFNRTREGSETLEKRESSPDVAVPLSMSASMADFEMIDSASGVESAANAGNGTSRNRKKKSSRK